MERDSLELLLKRGLSYGEIGRRFARHPSTVSYWAKRHGLESTHKERHTPKGALDRSRVEELLAGGASIAVVAQTLGTSESTVKYWLRKWSLRTVRSTRVAASRAAREEARASLVRDCARHGRVMFVIEGRGSYRCGRCRSDAVAKRRRTVKALLVEEAGGCCALCGYAQCLDALQFHHLDPSTKSFAIGSRGLTRSLDVLRVEAAKCALLCANCHAEVEAGIVSLAVEECPGSGGDPGSLSKPQERSGVAQLGRAIGC